MQELFPVPDRNVDVASRLAGDVRPAHPDRPWVSMVMIASLDGAIAVDGLSGGLGGPADLERFVAARRMADAIVVGSTTVSMEDYQPTAVPLAILTRSLSLDPAARVFGDPDRQPLLYTTTDAARARGGAFNGIAEVIDLGDSVSPARVLADLHHRGRRSVMLEGGPTINGAFLDGDLVDELLLTYSPLVVGGEAPRLVNGPSWGQGRRFSVDRVLLADDLLFVRYLRRSDESA